MKYKKTIGILVCILFFGASIIPSISGNDAKLNNNSEHDMKYKTICDWPIFRHDIMHTGYTGCIGNLSHVYKKWCYPTNGWVWSSPVLSDIDDDGLIDVVIGSYDNKVYSLEGENGGLMGERYVLDS